VAGIGSGLFAPTHQAALADVLAGRGQGGPALAAFQMTTDLGAISGPVIAGAVAQNWGFGPAFAMTGAIAFAAMIVWAFARETAPARTADSIPAKKSRAN
jgi:MFS family permease